MAMEEDAGKGYCHARRESNLKHMLCECNFLIRPPTGTPKRIISPGEGLLIFPTLPKGSS